MHDEVSIEKRLPNRVDGTLRKFALRVPECIYKCSGIIVFGKRIKSLVFSTDLSIIRNVNADAIMAVYPFTPQPVITQALLMAAGIPVFSGGGGGSGRVSSSAVTRCHTLSKLSNSIVLTAALYAAT